MEKLWKVDYNFIDQDHFDWFEVGVNCVSLTELSPDCIRAVCEKTTKVENIKEGSVVREQITETTESHEITNINHKYFRKTVII
jgi:hypothetical protein